MESESFTLDYFGKAVACRKQDDTYSVQISYIPLLLSKQEREGAFVWVDLEQQRPTALAEDVGRLIDEHFMHQ